MTIVLAIETSCDETAASVVSQKDGSYKIHSNVIASQVKDHAKWGGVVPELAARKHLELIPFVFQQSLEEANLSIDNIDNIASTVTPGLVGCLRVGSIFAKTLCLMHSKPFFGIHHLEGHLSSILFSNQSPDPPFLCLLVSGGHTELIKVDKNKGMNRLGSSHDDAAGEAFDKVGRLLGLGYPGGPAIERVAKGGDPFKFHLPKCRISDKKGGFLKYDFSFSGLKTAVLRLTQKLKMNNENIPIKDIAASFERVVAEVLVERSINCAVDFKLDDLVVVGGVAANKTLRKMMIEKADKKSIRVHLAPLSLCTDNAAMIGAAALSRLRLGCPSSSIRLGVSARFSINQAKSLYDKNPPF
tara:strand:- start:317 stop:1387 length:1071 start_codon:yes stop_codon:yes gene_type:complete